jgi:hypothetical protein
VHVRWLLQEIHPGRQHEAAFGDPLQGEVAVLGLPSVLWQSLGLFFRKTVFGVFETSLEQQSIGARCGRVGGGAAIRLSQPDPTSSVRRLGHGRPEPTSREPTNGGEDTKQRPGCTRRHRMPGGLRTIDPTESTHKIAARPSDNIVSNQNNRLSSHFLRCKLHQPFATQKRHHLTNKRHDSRYLPTNLPPFMSFIFGKALRQAYTRDPYICFHTRQ